MGGKNKSSQRTKNNTRPSSSGRSAELLGSLPTGFVGFTNAAVDTKSMPLAFPITPDSPDGELGTEFNLVIKKLNKKDPITKTKALQELGELVKEKSLDEVTSTLPYWSRLYRVLTNDTEHKVREATQSTHGLIVNKCGRAIAPYLKQIVPTWLTAQYDNYAPAASSAQASVQGAFPESKLPDVISFCKSEVMSHISANLIGDAQAALINSKALEPEVLEMRNQRIIMGSLQGFNFFVKHLPDKHSEWLWTEQLEIFDTNKFWKLTSDKCSQIRGAWFGVISREIERFPEQFGQQYGAKATKVLVNNLMEKDPLVAMQLWECFLLLTAHVKDWYSWVDKKEQLSKRIIDLLDNGGWGNATHLATIILPLLANLPEEMLTKEFYAQFFVAMVNGLNKKATLASKSHRQSYLMAIGECLKYVSIHQIDTFAVEIVTSALRTWLEKILESPYENQTRNNIIKYSATVMVTLVKYWLKQAKEGKSSEKYSQLVRNFWQNKCSTIFNQIEKLSLDREVIGRSIDGHILLLRTLNVSFEQEPKKRATIKFEVDEEEKVEKPIVENTFESDSKMHATYTHSLHNLIYKTCFHYLQFADTKQITLPIFVPLYSLLEDFNSKDLFVAIQKDFLNSIVKDDSLYGLYEGMFKRWMLGDTMRCKEVVHITFLLIQHMSCEEQSLVFKSFNHMVPCVVEEVISMCLSHPYSTYDYVRDWMKSDVVDITLVSICKRLVISGESNSKNLLLMSFSQDCSGAIIISDKACAGILSVLCEALKNCESIYLDMCASLASQLVTVLLTENKSEAYMMLLLQMFKLNASVKPNDENLSEDTWWEVKTSWQDGLSTLEEDERTEFIEEAIKFLQQSLSEDKEEIDTNRVDDFIELTTTLMVKFSEHSTAEENLCEIATISKALFLDSDDNSYSSICKTIEVHALMYDCLSGRINFYCGNNEEATKHIVSTAEAEDTITIDRDTLHSYIYRNLTRAKYLSTVVFGPQKRGQDMEEEVTEQDVDRVLNWSSTILADELIREQYMDSLHDYVVLQSVDKAYSFWPYHSIISIYRETIGSHLKDIANQMSASNEAEYESCLSLKSTKNGFYWPIARKYFKELINQNDQRALVSAETNCLVAYRAAYGMDSCHFAHHSKPMKHVSEVSTARKSNSIMDIMNEPWEKLVVTAAALNKLTVLVSKVGADMSESEWDNVTLTMCSYIHSIDKAKLWWGAPKVVIIAHAALKLLAAVESFTTNIKATSSELRSSKESAQLDEWNDVVSLEVMEHVYSLILGIFDESSDIELGMNHTLLLSALSEVVSSLSWHRLPKKLKEGELKLNRIKSFCLKVFTTESSQHQLKYLSYYVLKGLVETLVEKDLGIVKEWVELVNNPEEDGSDSYVEKPKFCLDSFAMILGVLGEAVDIQLSNIKMAESSITLAPFTETYNVVLSYLLLVEFILDICAKADHGLVQQQYIEFFRNGVYIETVMRNCLKLLPVVIINRARDPNQAPVVPPHFCDMFTNEHTFTATEPPLSMHIEALACRCMLLTLSGVGAVSARGWYGTLTGRQSKTVDNIVSTYITPSIIRAYYKEIQEDSSTLADVTMTSLLATNEFKAEYNLDGVKMELQVKLNSNHPLSIPKIELLKTPTNYSQMITSYIAYQNGTVLGMIRLWFNMLTATMSKTPCYICYSYMHPVAGQLPTLICNTCKNRYHNVCVFKWFRSTVNKSSCPICRSLF